MKPYRKRAKSYQSVDDDSDDRYSNGSLSATCHGHMILNPGLFQQTIGLFYLIISLINDSYIWMKSLIFKKKNYKFICQTVHHSFVYYLIFLTFFLLICTL